MYEGIIVSAGIFLLLGIITYIGTYYTIKTNSPRVFLGIYILFLTLAQFFASKTLTIFDFGLGITVIAPAGVLVFPFTMQITDSINEKFGRKAVYEMIWIGLFSQILLVILLILALYLPILEGDDPLAPFAIVPAITLASWISFLISERFDAWIYNKFKEILQKKTDDIKDWWKYLWIRNVTSDILSLGLDSLLFVPLAFSIIPYLFGFIDPSSLEFIINDITIIFEIIIGQISMKWLLGVIDTPYMYLTRWMYNKG